MCGRALVGGWRLLCILHANNGYKYTRTVAAEAAVTITKHMARSIEQQKSRIMPMLESTCSTHQYHTSTAQRKALIFYAQLERHHRRRLFLLPHTETDRYIACASASVHRMLRVLMLMAFAMEI